MDSGAIEIAALGRPLHPGMLYDCRSDTFIPGVSLWNQAAIKNDMIVEPQPYTYCNYVASDSITEKTKLIDMSASLKASFMSGQVEVGGSASYLNDTKSSLKQCRVTMKYKQMTEYRYLTMTQLGHVTYPEVFDHQTATHVITAVLYGAEAFMVFDQMSSDEESKQDIQQNMEEMIQKVPNCEISDLGKVVMTDDEKKVVENFSCTFHGDLILQQNPSNYEEAVLLYKKLPKLLGAGGSKAVPVRVWLYPLKKLDTKAAQLVREIRAELVTCLEVVMGQLHEAEMRANDSIKRCQAIKATYISNKLHKFQSKRSIYTQTLKWNISKVLPAIREATAEEQKLVDILKFHEESSFTYDKMKNWLDEKDSEIGVLERYIKLLENTPICPSGPEQDKVNLDPEYENVAIFNFTSLQYEEPYLSNLHKYLDSTEFKEMEEISVAHDFSFKEEALPWFRDPGISKRMREMLHDFKSYDFLCKKIISYISDPSYPGARIIFYKKGERQDGAAEEAQDQVEWKVQHTLATQEEKKKSNRK